MDKQDQNPFLFWLYYSHFKMYIFWWIW